MKLIALTRFSAVFLVADMPLSAWNDVSDPDVYSFYSSLSKTERFFAPRGRIAIAFSPMQFAVTFACNKPLSDEDRRLVEVARDNGERWWRWQKRFQFGRDYVLVPTTEIMKARKCIGLFQEHRPAAGCGSYVNVRDVWFFSVPAFNPNHTRALVSYSRLFGDGGPERLTIYKKVHGVWKADPGGLAGCTWSFWMQ